MVLNDPLTIVYFSFIVYKNTPGLIFYPLSLNKSAHYLCFHKHRSSSGTLNNSVQHTFWKESDHPRKEQSVHPFNVFFHWKNITGCSVMNTTYCLLQYFVLIIHRLCLLWVRPAASSRPSILSGTCFLFSISKFRAAWGPNLFFPLYAQPCKFGCPAAKSLVSEALWHLTCNLSSCCTCWRDLTRGLTGSKGLPTSSRVSETCDLKLKQI